MPGLEANTDSYNQPAQPSILDNVQKFGNIQQQKQAIDQAKLDQANQALGYMVRAMGSLGPNASKEDYAKAAQNAVDQGLVPQQQENVFLQHLQAAPDSPTFYKQFMSSAMEGQKQIELHTGINSSKSDNATEYQGKTNPLTGGFQSTTEINQQLPPTAPNVDNRTTLPNGQPNPNYQQPGYVGPSGPRGVLQSQGGARLPVAAPNAPAIAPRPAINTPRQALPVAPAVSGPTGPTVNKGTEFSNRFDAAFPNRVATGAAPGVAEAIKTVGEQSGKDYATALQTAGNIQTALQPDLAVLDIVKGKAPGDFGPGTDNLNQLKKIAVTWLPNVDPKIINDSSDYDTVKKYLIQGARSAGNTGTNDQLAAAFEANPNTTMNTATIENIVKSRVALKKMEAAQVLLANQQNIAPDQFSKWKAQNQNVLDPRAFGFDMMNDDAKQKLVNKLKKDPKAYQKFESSLQFAHDAELIGPPAGK
jgi:hypothetical protein